MMLLLMVTLDKLTDGLKDRMEDALVVTDQDLGLVHRLDIVGLILLSVCSMTPQRKDTCDVRDIHDGPRVARVKDGGKSDTCSEGLDQVLMANMSLGDHANGGASSHWRLAIHRGHSWPLTLIIDHQPVLLEIDRADGCTSSARTYRGRKLSTPN